MRVLFITHHFLNENGGGSFASRAFINAFAEISDQIILLYPENGKSIEEFVSSKVRYIHREDK